MPKLVAVTGATGFIGHALIDRLVENGWKIRALTRKPQTGDDNIQWIHGDLADTSALHLLVKDADAVIHCAGSVRGRSYKEFEHTNVDGTNNLLSAINDQNITPRFLLISSLAARQPELSWYAKSKYMAEQPIVSSHLPWAVLRPTAVYGPGDKELKPLFQAMYRGLLPVVGKLENRFGLLHIADLVEAIQLWLTADKPIKGIFEIDDGLPGGYSFNTLVELAQQVWQKPVRCITIPNVLMRSIASLNLGFSRVFRYSPMLTPGKVNELQHHDWICDNAPLIQALPTWQPRIRLHESLSQVI
ncbi:MAG: NAD-dependent epimerase/dehydratase family protein [Betaproteobacteria bacterium]|nr:NAD-dependent epimerase/dehydratase family protein [Betaproteobacteria bacterium]